MGPVMLKIKHGNLMEDWEASSRDTVEDYKSDRSAMSEVCVNENWIRSPPNVLFFALQRVRYDVKA